MTFALVTGSGVVNAGKLTSQMAILLIKRRPHQYIWIHARQSTGTLRADIGDAEQVIVINGCGDCCAKKGIVLIPHCPPSPCHRDRTRDPGRREGEMCSTMRSKKLSVPS